LLFLLFAIFEFLYFIFSSLFSFEQAEIWALSYGNGLRIKEVAEGNLGEA